MPIHGARWGGHIVIGVLQRLISPIGILGAAVGLWLLCYISPFNTYTVRQSPEAHLLLAGYVAAFLCGILIWRKPPSDVRTIRHDPVRAQRLAFTLLLGLAMLGLALKFLDLLTVKNFSDFATAAEFRLAEVEEGPRAPGAISALGVLLYPLGLIAFLASLYLHDRLYLWQRLGGFACLVGFGAHFVLQGGRTLIVTAGIMVASALVLRGLVDPPKRLEGSRLAAFLGGVFLAVLVFIGYSAHVMQSRLETMGVTDPAAFLSSVEDDRGFRLEEPYRSLLDFGSPLEAGAVMTASSLTYYVNHGFFNFSELYEHERGLSPTGGLMQFGAVARFLKGVGVDTPDPMEGLARIPRLGLFYTFFGNVLLDYGVVGGLFFCIFLGLTIQAVWSKARSGSLPCLLLYPFFVSVIFHFPMMDMISGGYGIFVVFAIGLSTVLFGLCGRLVKSGRRELALQTA